MTKLTLKNGFECEIDKTILEDMEMVEAMAAADGDEPLRIVEVMQKLLGDEQKKALYDYVRNEKGRVPIDAVTGCVMEIFESLGEEGKNL